MYERNAIVIDRYFSNVFGYDKKNNVKNNANNYFELVSILEKYQGASEIENNVMDEFEKVANTIKSLQKKQENYEQKYLKYFGKRQNLFLSLEEDAEDLKRDFERIEEEIINNENNIKDNIVDFVESIKEFNEKSEIRNKCGRERRIIENDYQKILNATADNFNGILKDKLKEMKSFLKSEDKEFAKIEMKENISKNGAKEKVPFDENIINKAIDTSLYIEGKKAEILLSIYEKTSKLLDEINKDTVKIETHKKQVRDSKSKLDFLNSITEYIILFLDNERMNTIGGQAEHERVMSKTCENMQNDLVEIQNMYSLLIKEINGKTTKKLYKQLYNVEYLNEIKEQENQCEKNISKLNMIGTVIYPDYWRLEGMKKIYDTFKTIMTEVYEVDLSEYEPIDITFEVNKKILSAEIENYDEKDKKIQISENNLSSKNTNKVEEKESTKSVLNKDQKEVALKFDVSKISEDNNDDDEDDEEFHWDIEDENDDRLFSDNKDKNEEEEDDDDYELEILAEKQDEDDEEDEERDKEIDELLGIFDSEDNDTFDDTDEDVEDHILQIEDDDELDDSIFMKNDEEENTDKSEKPKRKKLFGRRK